MTVFSNQLGHTDNYIYIFQVLTVKIDGYVEGFTQLQDWMGEGDCLDSAYLFPCLHFFVIYSILQMNNGSIFFKVLD